MILVSQLPAGFEPSLPHQHRRKASLRRIALLSTVGLLCISGCKRNAANKGDDADAQESSEDPSGDTGPEGQDPNNSGPSGDQGPKGDTGKGDAGGPGGSNTGENDPDNDTTSKDNENTNDEPEDPGPTDPSQGLAEIPSPSADVPDLHPFTGYEACEFCHVQGRGVLSDPQGESVAPTQLWRGSMMAFSARDPYWLAQFSHELEVNPKAIDLVSDKCTRCHAPAANELLRRKDAAISINNIIRDITPLGHLGREGVSCTVCHQITSEGLGDANSFTGNYVIGDDRLIFGPHQDPLAVPMQENVEYTPTASQHMLDSGHCATCHTVITQALDKQGNPTGPDFPEQVPYLEWRNSDFPGQNRSCQSCHSPRADSKGQDFTTELSIRPASLSTQREVGDHGFVGGNVYMLELLAENRDWAGILVDKRDITETAKKTQSFLRTAIVLDLERDISNNAVTVTLYNQTGHKFPTAYPTRRAWIELIAKDGSDKKVFHSGAFDAQGRVRYEKRPAPHYEEISDPKQSQIYEGIMADAQNKITHSLLAPTHWWKDNRILPRGWKPDHPDAKITAPVGTQKDPNFKAGEDQITYRLPPSARKVEVKLWFQTVPPHSVDALYKNHPSPASQSFKALVNNKPAIPELVTEQKLSWD